MIYAILLGVFGVAGFLVGFGDGGRGTYSQVISAVGGLVWLGGLIYAVYAQGLWFGLGALLASFVIAAVTINIGKSVISSFRKY